MLTSEIQVIATIYPTPPYNTRRGGKRQDIEEGDLNRPEMTAKLVCTLETAMYRAMQEK